MVGLRLNVVWRRARTIPVFLALALLLSSCITITAESEFQEDGSASHVYEFTFEKALMSEMGEGFDVESDIEGDFAEMEALLEGSGYSVEWIETDELIGSRVSITTEDSQNVGEILNNLFSAGADGGTQPVTAFTGTFDQDGNEHTLDLTVDGSSLFDEGMDDEDLGDTAGFSADMLAGMIDVTYTVRLPGEIDVERTNGQVLEDGRVQWDLPLSGSQAFLAVSATEGDGPSMLLLLGGTGLLLLAAAAAILGFFLMRRKPEPAPAYVTTASPAAPLPAAQPED